MEAVELLICRLVVVCQVVMLVCRPACRNHCCGIVMIEVLAIAVALSSEVVVAPGDRLVVALVVVVAIVLELVTVVVKEVVLVVIEVGVVVVKEVV